MTNNKPLSFRKEFEEWMREYKMYEEATITTRANNVEKIERIYGTLSSQWKKDNFETLLDKLAYTKTDQYLNRKFTGELEISGDLCSCLATYRSALKLYGAFLNHRKVKEIGYPFGEIGEKVHQALENLSKTAKRKKSYSANDIKEIIVRPLVAGLQKELAPLGYYIETEKVALINDNKKKSKDRYDIFAQAEGKPIIIIEVDTHRGDQVSKKVVSRMSFHGDSEVLYVALVYPNDHQNKEAEKKECKKYFRFINDLFASFSSPQKHFMSHWL